MKQPLDHKRLNACEKKRLVAAKVGSNTYSLAASQVTQKT